MTTNGSEPFGLLGRTLGHSWSPRIHATLGSTPYALFEREPQDVAAFVRDGSWRGINVTIPYKRRAAELADECSERVRALGVANTLVRREDGSIYADNTDVLGFSWMLERFCVRELGMGAREAFCGKKVLVLGSGGASQAVRAALDDVGACTVVISRTGPNTYESITQSHTDALLVINTTPVGMYPSCPQSPVSLEDLAELRQLCGVLDVVYNPERTSLCMMAQRLGIPFESGLAMLVAQARFASEVFLGRSLPESLVEQIEHDIRRERRRSAPWRPRPPPPMARGPALSSPAGVASSPGRRTTRCCTRTGPSSCSTVPSTSSRPRNVPSRNRRESPVWRANACICIGSGPTSCCLAPALQREMRLR